MLNFKPIEVDDKKEAMPYLCAEPFGSTESSFADIYIWGEQFNTRICVKDGILYIRAEHAGKVYYLFPFGSGDLRAALENIREDARRLGTTPELRGITDKMREKIEAAAPGLLTYEETRDTFDYIYDAKELIELKGRKFHQKRNHLNKFLKTYDGRFKYEEITRENFDEVYDFQNRWLLDNITPGNKESLKAEMRAIRRALKDYFALGFTGGIIRIDGHIAAYSMGTRLCTDSFLISVEKGDYAYDGIYQAINQMFAEKNCFDVKYINREDDTGSPGLRRAKLSYKPVILLTKYRAVWKND
ncbi:MAG: DUF2156 domain-containing protein [Clostridiales bacterium]|jgi:hypothetical protein|nr:DUF2156 domain-containing protein [Clostridiales bacterium]